MKRITHEPLVGKSNWAAPTFGQAGLMLSGLAVVVFVLLRLWHVPACCFDCDEVFSLAVVNGGWSDALQKSLYDIVHPPLFYFLLKLWSVGGDSASWFRLLPVLFACATLAPFFLLCRELELRFAEINLSLILMSFNSFLIAYSQQLRMYSVLQFLATTSLLLFVKFLKTSASRGLWLALFGVNLLLVYTHYYGWLLIGTELAFLLAFRNRKALAFLLSIFLLLLCFGPWAYAGYRNLVARHGLEENLGWISRPRLAHLAMHYSILNGAFGFTHSMSVGVFLFALPPIWWLGQLLRANWIANKKSIDTFSLLLFFSFLPTLVAFLASWVLQQSVWGSRYLIYTAIPYLLLVSVATLRVRPRLFRLILLSLIVTWSASSGLMYLRQTHVRVDWDTLVAQLNRAEPSNSRVRIYALGYYSYGPMSYYLGGVGNTRFDTRLTNSANDVSKIEDNYFWWVYRDADWLSERLPEQVFANSGYRVREVFVTRVGNDQIKLLNVSR